MSLLTYCVSLVLYFKCTHIKVSAIFVGRNDDPDFLILIFCLLIYTNEQTGVSMGTLTRCGYTVIYAASCEALCVDTCQQHEICLIN